MMDTLDDLIARLANAPSGERDALIKQAIDATQHMRWIPSPGPQTEAYFSKADILLFGGSPGGGKTSLILGLAYNEHKRTLIMRRQYTDLTAIVEDMIKIHGSRKGYNGSPPPSLRVSETQLIEMGAAARIGDEQHFQGNPHDLIAFDEATQFAESQVRFLMGWLRSTDKNQRCRVVLATNPPLSSEGAWVLEMFAPWFNPRHSNPAKPGELRWFITDDDGRDVEVDGPTPVTIGTKTYEPLSRTFIPSSLADNPYLADTDYGKRLDALPEPLRSILLGGFRALFRDAKDQCIPTDWIKQAQARWTKNPPPGVPMCTIGVDVASVNDDIVLAPRHDGWFAPMITCPGKDAPLGKDVAGLIFTHRRDKALIVVDMGGGYGGPVYEHLLANEIEVVAYKGATTVETRTKDRQLRFTNKRTEAYWRFREALDPGQEGGSPIALPDDPKLVADLTAPTFTIGPNGITLESKEKVVAKLGRSPDRGDAVVMAWSEGAKYDTHGGEWLNEREQRSFNRTPKVITSKQRRGH